MSESTPQSCLVEPPKASDESGCGGHFASFTGANALWVRLLSHRCRSDLARGGHRWCDRLFSWASGRTGQAYLL